MTLSPLPIAPADDWLDARRLHAALSEPAARFLDFVAREPAMTRRESFRALREENPFPSYELQPWPTLVDRTFLDRATRANRGLAALVRSVPARLLGGDPGRIAEQYGLGLQRAVLAAEVLREGGYAEAILGRGDYVLGPTGLQCLEFNMSSRLGGWRVGLWRHLYPRVPLLRRFFEEEGSRYRVTSAAGTLLSHLLARHRARHGEPDGFQVVLAIDSNDPHIAPAAAFVDAELRRVLAEEAPGAEGRAVVCRYADLESRGGGLYHDGRRVHVIVDQGDTLSREVFFCWMAGEVDLYNAVIDEILGDKRNLALLSEHAEDGPFDEAERAVIREHLPWTRIVRPGATTFRGEEVDLPELIRSRRADLVLKPGLASGGKGVFLGASTPRDEWTSRLGDALAAGDWVVQERVRSQPLLYQHGPDGFAVHDVVWGLFSWGESGFSGGYLRMMPHRGPGVVNVSQGAVTGLIFEVEDGGEAAGAG